jgi:NTE family protein
MNELPMYPSFATRPRIGLALSCGGARGLAHVGVIQVLEENDIPVDVIAGTSMGAYVGCLWAAGYDGKELEHFAAEIGSPKDLWRRLDLVIPPVKGLFLGNGIRERLEAALKGATFDCLQRELHVVAANIDTLERKVFSAGDVAMAVHASFAIPGICVPVEIDGYRYVDGGIVDPLPVGILSGVGCDLTIAVTVVPSMSDVQMAGAAVTEEAIPNVLVRSLRAINRSFNVFAHGNVIDTLRRSITAAEIRMAHTSARRASMVIRPAVTGSAWHDYHRYPNYIELGRRAAEASLPALFELLSNHNMKGDRHETALIAH